jgi:cation-transporting ATPase 13A3/4/5
MTIDLERGQTVWEETMGFLKVAEYRYTRFALQPGTGKWTMIRDWRDSRWTSIKAVGAGLSEAVREQRRILFGLNVIDIEGKSLLGLLVDEVSLAMCH